METIEWREAADRLDRGDARIDDGRARREDVVMCALSLWLLAGIVVDGLAHQLQPDLETFFTPWHAIYYAGYLATACWTARVWTRRSRAARDEAYGWGVVGLGLFAVGGLADLVWHTVVGIETSVAALTSPPHLLLFAGEVLLVTSPWRSAARGGSPRRLRDVAPALCSLTTAMAIIGFFWLYASPFWLTMGGRDDLHALRDISRDKTVLLQWHAVGMMSIAITNLLLLVPVHLMISRWARPPRGVIFISVAGFAVTMSVLGGLRSVREILFMLVALAAADLFVPIVAGRWPLRRRWLVPLCVVGTVWPGYFAGLAVDQGIAWPLELWLGAISWSALGAVALSYVLGRTYHADRL